MTSARLMVVDDEITIRNFIVRVLERVGYEVKAASDGQEALTMMQAQTVDLLLTDIRMERMGGVDLLRETRTRFPQTAVILFTGHATVQSAVEALRRGASDYLLKPVKNEDILSAVETALQQRSQERRRDRLESIAGQFLNVMDVEVLDLVPTPRRIEVGELTLDTAAFRASLSKSTLALTPTEFRLLGELARSPGAALDYVVLVQAACGYNCTRQEAREIIGTHVLNLRKKMGVAADDALYIESVRGVGYRLVPPDA